MEAEFMKPKFIMLVGVLSSGKSTYAHSIVEEHQVVSSDAIRHELYGDENDQTHNGEVFNEVHRRVRQLLKNGETAVMDATNLSAKRRRNFLKTLRDLECTKECVIVVRNIAECIASDILRDRTVGDKVITRMVKQFQLPEYEEGWDKIDVHQVGTHIELEKLLQGHNPHDCPKYHLEDIETHCRIASGNASAFKPAYLQEAALYHDIGKLYTKDFHNAKGEPTEDAHYYGHENVSTYLYLTSKEFSCYRLDIGLVIAWLIANHMRPYFQGYEKWRKNYPSDLIKILESLHKCDMDAMRRA